MKPGLSNNRAGFHKGLGFLALILLICGCKLTAKQKIELYGCYWNCPNELGENGWCCEKEVPKEDWYIFNCENAGNRIVQQ